MAHKVDVDPQLVYQQVENLSRSPFRAVLSKILAASPSQEALANQAERHPDRWAQTLAIVARLGGYTDKLQVEGSITHTINDLSDSQLEARLEDLRRLDMQSNAVTLHPLEIQELPTRSNQ